MADFLADLYGAIGQVRQDIGRLDGTLDGVSKQLAELSGRLNTFIETVTRGQADQDTRLVNVVTEQAETRGEDRARRTWQSLLVPAGVSGAISGAGILLAHLWPIAPPHH